MNSKSKGCSNNKSAVITFLNKMMKHRTIFLLVFSFYSLSILGQPDIYKSYSLKLNNDSVIPIQIGKIQVPENSHNQAGRTLAIRFLRLKSYSHNPGTPIVYLAGGPGSSGIDAARGRRWKLFDTLRHTADVIVLDQRGTGMSDSVPRCVSNVKLHPDSATHRSYYIRQYRKAAEECMEYWQNEGVDIEGYTTLESVKDLEKLRIAIGAPKISLLGISYGTHLALAYAQRYPEKVDRMVLASTEGLTQTVKLPHRTEAYLKRLQSAIDSHAPSRDLYPDVRELMDRVLEEVALHPPRLNIPEGRNNPAFSRTMGKFEMQRISGYMLADPKNASYLLSSYRAADTGNYIWFRRYIDWFFGENGEYIALNGMSLAMELASGISDKRLQIVEKDRKQALLSDALNFPMPHLTAVAPHLQLPAAFREMTNLKNETLFLSGTLDGRTYPEAAREVARHFENHQFITIKNAGHNLFFSSPEVLPAIVRFFNGQPVGMASIKAPLPDFVPD